MTCDEDEADIHHVLAQLESQGLIQDSGQRRNGEIVWVLTDTAKSTLHAQAQLPGIPVSEIDDFSN